MSDHMNEMELDEEALEAAWDTLPQGSTLISRKAFKRAIITYFTRNAELEKQLAEAQAENERLKRVREGRKETIMTLAQWRLESQKSEAPGDDLEIALVRLLVDVGFHHKRIASLFDCNQGRIAEIATGKKGARVGYEFKVK